MIKFAVIAFIFTLLGSFALSLVSEDQATEVPFVLAGILAAAVVLKLALDFIVGRSERRQERNVEERFGNSAAEVTYDIEKFAKEAKKRNRF